LEKLTRNSFPGILCGIVILILTGIPGSVFPRVKPPIGFDKVVHILMYASFAFLCIWGYRKQFISNGKTYRRKALLLTTIISICYGGLTELMQEFIVPSRIGDKFDFIADMIGTLIGILVFYLFFKNKK
jgi:VanZ family protein